MEEIWKDVKGYEGLYQVSNMGRVKNLKRNTIKTPCSVKDYYRIVLSKNNNKVSTGIHCLVAKAFINNPENKPEVNHKDGIKTNNIVSNLEWCTRIENVHHSWETGLSSTQNIGMLNGFSKLNDKQVLEIREKYIPRKYSSRKLAKEYNVEKGCILSIVNRKSWTHI